MPPFISCVLSSVRFSFTALSSLLSFFHSLFLPLCLLFALTSLLFFYSLSNLLYCIMSFSSPILPSSLPSSFPLSPRLSILLSSFFSFLPSVFFVSFPSLQIVLLLSPCLSSLSSLPSSHPSVLFFPLFMLLLPFFFSRQRFQGQS